MKVFQHNIISRKKIERLDICFNLDILFLFISITYDEVESIIYIIKNIFKNSIILGAITAGEIIRQSTVYGVIVMVVLNFIKNNIRLYSTDLPSDVDSKVLAHVDKLRFKLPNKEHYNQVIRPLLDIDKKKRSLLISKEISVESHVRIMKATSDRLILAAENAAQIIAKQNNHQHELAILISNSGRIRMLGDLVYEEVEAVINQFTENTKSIGCEIAPIFELPKTCLHNLTICVTIFPEF
ncbi:FIST C-terminal domain-containing protein [Maribacter sp. ACAM166]|uniref:FIST C-terminal domain-containing protein n=1 Tax=Maribacter sp. ACAM166 TaxID=2508996 RepID=UPI0010FE1E22|nr:FIST C-terminal domain-containing protein [Maribacter sp. ACAM166]TLP72796.1 hypothetical protein ES765_18625 [Maribacter sp. ACAM166]